MAQARLAARNAIGLNTVLRRYFAGYSLLTEFLIEEAERDLLPDGILQQILRSQAVLFDRLVVAVSDEYAREADSQHRSPERRRTERVRRLLKGEPLDTSEFHYDLDGNHIAVIATGPEVAELMRELANAFDCRLLLIQPEGRLAWAWLGTRRALGPVGPRLEAFRWPDNARVALGEPAVAINGWRLTHRQAAAAFSVARHSTKRYVRYLDVSLLASILQDDVLAGSLHKHYLAPLERERDGGRILRETLRAYLKARHNLSSAAAALGVNRNTVSNRLRLVEERLGCRLNDCVVEMEAALRLHSFREDARPDLEV